MLQCFRNYSILYISVYPITISPMIPHDIQDIPVSILNMTVARMCSVSQVYSGATVVMWRLPRGEGSRWSVGEDQIVVGETSDLWAKLQKLTRNTKKNKKSIKKTYVEDIYIYITHSYNSNSWISPSEIWNPWIPWVNVPIRIPSSDPRCCIDKDAESVWCAHVENPVETSGVWCRSWYLQDMHTVYTWIIDDNRGL